MVSETILNHGDLPTAHKATLRVLTVIELLTTEDDGLTMAQIGGRLGIPKGTLSPILHTMRDTGFLRFDVGTGRYRIGMRAYLAGRTYERTSDDLARIEAVMRGVVDSCGETCQLGVLDGSQALYVAKVDSPASVQLVTDVGRLMPLHCTAVGKALLSDKTSEELDRILPREFEAHTPMTTRTRAELDAQLERVRELGFAEDPGEVLPDVECIAVPISRDGHVAYGMSVSTPSYRMSVEKRGRILEALRAAQKELTDTL